MDLISAPPVVWPDPPRCPDCEATLAVRLTVPDNTLYRCPECGLEIWADAARRYWARTYHEALADSTKPA